MIAYPTCITHKMHDPRAQAVVIGAWDTREVRKKALRKLHQEHTEKTPDWHWHFKNTVDNLIRPDSMQWLIANSTHGLYVKKTVDFSAEGKGKGMYNQTTYPVRYELIVHLLPADQTMMHLKFNKVVGNDMWYWSSASSFNEDFGFPNREISTFCAGRRVGKSVLMQEYIMQKIEQGYKVPRHLLTTNNN